MAVLILNYSRSGGTLLSSVLAQLNNVILVSEVNPIHNASGSISVQVKKWYGIDISATSFVESVFELEAHCLKNKKTLIIRDFSFVDFTPNELNEFNPALTFSSLKILQSVIDIKVISFVRDAFDIWISRNCPPQFSTYYLKYVQQLKQLDHRIFKYESFCAEPALELQKICKTIGIEFNVKALKNPNKYDHVTGDNQIKKKSRGRKLNQIQQLKRKHIPQKWRQKAKADIQLKEVNKMLSYSSDFDFQKMGSTNSSWISSINWYVYRLLNPSHLHRY